MVGAILLLAAGALVYVIVTQSNDSTAEFPTLAPSIAPSMTPTDMTNCFNTPPSLLVAIDEYIADNSETSRVALHRGWPISTWCVGKIIDFSGILSRTRNRQTIGFNEDISMWDVSQGTDFTRAFEGSTFN